MVTFDSHNHAAPPILRLRWSLLLIFTRDSICCNCLTNECCRVADVPRVLNFLVPFTDLKSIHLHFYEQSLGISTYEGTSLNNRNFITFYKSTYKNCLCVIFRHSPPASQCTRSTCPQACGCPLEKSFLAWPLTNFTPPPLPRRHLQTCGPANVLS